MDEIVQNAAYNPDPKFTADMAIAELNADNIVPAGVVRSAVSVAGGVSHSNFIMTALANGATVPIPDAPVGGVGTGPIINDMLNAAGADNQNYEWVHGPTNRPFEPHLDLDGTEFGSFSDDVLLNTTGFPNKDHFYPGDHDGCLCDAMPLWVGVFDVTAAEEAAAAQ
jgi:hypothetical protein